MRFITRLKSTLVIRNKTQETNGPLKRGENENKLQWLVSAPSALTKKSHYFHYMPNLKGWVLKTASVIDICKQKRKKGWPSQPPKYSSHCNGYSIQSLCDPSAKSILTSFNPLNNWSSESGWFWLSKTWWPHQLCWESWWDGTSPMSHPQPEKHSQTLSKEHLSRKAKTKPPRLGGWAQNTLGVKKESLAAGSCKAM